MIKHVVRRKTIICFLKDGCRRSSYGVKLQQERCEKKIFSWHDDVRETVEFLKNKSQMTDVDDPNLRQMNGLPDFIRPLPVLSFYAHFLGT